MTTNQQTTIQQEIGRLSYLIENVELSKHAYDRIVNTISVLKGLI